MVNIGNDWDEILKDEFSKEYYLKLRAFLKSEYKSHCIHPDMYDIFNALKWTSYANTKIVILGQDPYHEVGQAHGLAFSVQKGVKIPPSLLNIYKELHNELGLYIPNNGYLEKWAKHGVLMLNSVLTVRNGQAFSHQGKGWEKLTDEAIKKLSERPMPVVFILWGAAARKKAALIDRKKNIIIESPHPSPLSANRGFFGSRPFSKTNAALEALGETPIDWQLPEKVELTEK